MTQHQSNTFTAWFRRGYQRLLPLPLRLRGRYLRLRLINSIGPRPYACPICGARLRRFAMFKPSPTRSGRAALCPFCLSLERTRMIWLYWQMSGLLADPLRLLHVAPQPGLERAMRQQSSVTCVTLDLERTAGVDVRADLTRLFAKAAAFELIYCSNVLEHIPADAAAMRELYRVLKPGGLAIIQVPLTGETTFEDGSITSAADRDKYFGQPDHVRAYGRDIKLRLEQAGFEVEECWLPDALGLAAEQLVRYGVNKRELIHLCRKPKSITEGDL